MNIGRNFGRASENQFYFLFSNYFSNSTLKEEKIATGKYHYRDRCERNTAAFATFLSVTICVLTNRDIGFSQLLTFLKKYFCLLFFPER